MAFFNPTAKSASLAFIAALISASGLPTPAVAGNNSSKNCENGQLIGTFALQAKSNSKFVKNENGILNAKNSSQPSRPSKNGVFELYSLKGMPGATDKTFALRSTKNRNQWWRVRNNSSVVELNRYQCKSDRTSTTFIGRGAYGALALQSRKTNMWIYVTNNRMRASWGAPPNNKSVFKLIPIGQASNPGNNPPPSDPSPTPPNNTPANINGWFKGNRFGYYTAQSSGGRFQMKAFTNSGKLLNLFKGTISGNRVTGTWRNYCNNRSGNATLLYQNGSLRRIAGNTGNIKWNPINRPSIQLESQPSCNSGSNGSGSGSGSQPSQQTPNLIGWWKGNRSGFYRIEMRQEIPGQNNFTMKGYSDKGQLLNTFVGRTIGNAITGSWRNNCNNISGTATLQYNSGDIIKINGTTTTNTRWSRTNRRPINLSTTCPGTESTPTPTPQQASKQKLTLKRQIWVYDQNMIGSNQQGTKTQTNIITIERPTRNSSTLSFPNAKHCIGNTNSVDKSSASVDKEGVARFNFSIKLKEGSCTGGLQIGSKNFSNFITAAPGRTVTRSYRINGTGGSKVKITYTLTNQTK